jgi:hypothetical protein
MFYYAEIYKFFRCQTDTQIYIRIFLCPEKQIMSKNLHMKKILLRNEFWRRGSKKM